MADVAPYGRDLVSGIIRAFTSSDTLTDEDGTPLVASGDTVNVLGFTTSTSIITISGGSPGPVALPASTISVSSNASRKILLIFAICTIEVRVLSGGDTTGFAEVEVGGSPVYSSPNHVPAHMEGGVSGAPASAGTHGIFFPITGGSAVNPGSVTWGSFVKLGATSGETSCQDRNLLVIEVLS